MLVSLSNIQKSFSIYPVLESISFHINERDKIGIVGANGCGKTTLFKIITGQETQEQGDVFIRKNTKIGYLDQIPDYQTTSQEVLYEAFESILAKKKALDDLSKEMVHNHDERLIKRYGILQEEFLQLGGYDIDVEFQKIVTGLHISDDMLSRSFSTLSGGEKSRVILGKILLEKPDLLLLDEPTNHLDLSSIVWLENYLAHYDGAVVIISHDRFLLDRTVTQILNIENGKSYLYKGNFSFYIKEKAVMMDSLWKEYEKQNKKIAKMEEQIERYRIWGKMRDSDKMYRRAKELEKRLARMDRLDKPYQNKALSFHMDTAGRTGKEAIKVEGFGKSFDNIPLLKDVDFTIRYGDKAFLIGDNGTGKSTLFKALLQDTDYEGTIKIATKAKIGKLDQEVVYPTPGATVVQEYRRIINVGENEARNHLAQFLFFSDDVFKKVSDISGGEKTRLELCKLVHSDTNVLLLDEPTNHLDIDSKEMLESNLSEYNGTMFIISHDRYFIGKLADYTLVLDNNTLLHEYSDFEDFYENRPTELDKPTLPKVKQQRRQPKQTNYLKIIDDLEQKISEINELIELELQAADTDYEKIGTLIEERENLEDEYLHSIDQIQ